MVCHVEEDPRIPRLRWLLPEVVQILPWVFPGPTRQVDILVTTECDGFPLFPLWQITGDGGGPIAIIILGCGSSGTLHVIQSFDQRVIKVQGYRGATLLNTRYVEPLPYTP